MKAEILIKLDSLLRYNQMTVGNREISNGLIDLARMIDQLQVKEEKK